jgi:glycosyltransferase involved in cell wall biosynthesis
VYLVAIQVPIYVSGHERLLTTDWKRSLLLLRDSFDGRFGRIQVIAPSLDASTRVEQPLEPLKPDEEIDLFPSFPERTRARAFWTEHLAAWRRDLSALLPQADVVHSGLDDVYRPIAFTGFLMGLHMGKPTVFVQDTDQVLQMRELTANANGRERAKQVAYCFAYERSVRYSVKRAGLSLLKGHALQQRYGRYAKNTKNFHDTSYLTSEVVPRAHVEARLASLLRGERPIKLVYCGRFEARKGLSDSLSALAEARGRGARVTFDLIGDGAERAALERQVQSEGLAESVRFLGMRKYGPQLLRDLGDYDALLFTPTAEDTPRMIFDGYAAGLPLLGYAIEYVRERETEDGAARSVPMRDTSALASLLLNLDRDRGQLAKLTQRAHEAALFHAADAWYKRRAEWTYEAVAAHRPR